MCLAKDDHVIEALAPDGTDEALDVRILPGRPGSDEHLGDLEPCYPAPELSSVNGIAIAQEVLGRGVPRECLDDLPGRPFRSWVCGDVEMQHAPPVVGEDDEDEEDLEGCRGNGEEIYRDQVLEVVLQKGSPGLGRWFQSLRHPARDSALGDFDPELKQLAVDPRRSPKWVCSGHPADESQELWIDSRSTRLATRLPSPVSPETLAMPANDGCRVNEDKRLSPAVPERPERGPEEAISWAKAGTATRARQDSELVSKCQVLEDEISPDLEGRSERPRESEEDLEHQLSLPAITAGCQRFRWADGVLANHRALRPPMRRLEVLQSVYGHDR